MKEEALKLADELDLIAGMIAIGDRIKWGQDSELMENGSSMIRRLAERIDSQENHLKLKDDFIATLINPLSDEEIISMFEHPDDFNCIDFARAIEERHGIK